MNSQGALDPPALSWLRSQMDLGRDLSLAVAYLRKRGFSDRAILAGIEAVKPRGNALLDGAMKAPPLIRRAPANLRKIDNPQFDLYTLEGFLNPRECARLIALVSHHLSPSPTAYDPGDKDFRTSKTAFLALIRSPSAEEIDAKICKTLGIRHEYSEGIQAQRYEAGEQFKPHWDCFRPDSDAYRRICGVRGNRTWTFMVYLNEGMEGGATRFTEIDHAVTPKLGMAVLWNNLNEDGSPNMATKHCGEPVISGHKVIITQWFRVHGDGPVFYE